MPESELLTVNQFAEREGISRQAVYKRLTKGLNQYCKLVDKTRYIDYSAYLRDKGAVDSLSDDNPDDNPEVDRLTTENNRLNREVDSLTEAVERLRAELSAERTAHRDDTAAAMELIAAESDRHAQQVKTLSDLLEAERAERVAAEDRHALQLKELTDALTDALSKAQVLQHEAQQLHAITAAAAVTVPDPDPAPDADPLEDQSDGSDQPPPRSEPRRSFWSRLFKR